MESPPPDIDEQLTMLKDVLGEDSQLLLVASEAEDGKTIVIVRTLYGDPRHFGVLIADLVTHVANAYVEEGFDPISVRNSLLQALGDELDFPTDSPQAIKKAARAIPEA
jgi:hypothetical protein